VKYRKERLPSTNALRKTPVPKRTPPATPTKRGPTCLSKKPADKVEIPNTKIATKKATFTLVTLAP